MSDKTVAQKLLIKEGHKVAFANRPEGYAALLGDLPGNVTILPEPTPAADVIQVFVANRRELEAALAKLKSLLNPRTIFWVTYHKGTSRVKTDINRDTVNAYAKTLGLEGVAMISVSDDWSALRLRLA